MKKALFILLAILIIGCNSDESNEQTGMTDLNLVTGVIFRQNFDDTPFQLGNPNVLINNKFVIYPNPAIENFNVVAVADETISAVWIVPANPEKIYQDQDFSAILNTGLYPEATIVANSDIEINGQSSNTIGVNIETLEPGYYRVFVKIGGEIYWDNLYKTDGNDEAEIGSLVNFWN